MRDGQEVFYTPRLLESHGRRVASGVHPPVSPNASERTSSRSGNGSPPRPTRSRGPRSVPPPRPASPEYRRRGRGRPRHSRHRRPVAGTDGSWYPRPSPHGGPAPSPIGSGASPILPRTPPAHELHRHLRPRVSWPTSVEIPLYRPLVEVGGRLDAYDFGCSPEHLVLGGGSGEHPALVVSDLRAPVAHFLSHWMLARTPEEDGGMEVVGKLIQDAGGDVAEWEPDPGPAAPPGPGGEFLHFAGWGADDYHAFGVRCRSAAFLTPFAPGEGALENWLAASLGEFAFFSPPGDGGYRPPPGCAAGGAAGLRECPDPPARLPHPGAADPGRPGDLGSLPLDAGLRSGGAAMEITTTFDPGTRRAWRQWLEANHRERTEIWLLIRRGRAGHHLHTWDAVEEDDLLRVDRRDRQAARRKPPAQNRFTPPAPPSNWTELNKKGAGPPLNRWGVDDRGGPPTLPDLAAKPGCRFRGIPPTHVRRSQGPGTLSSPSRPSTSGCVWATSRRFGSGIRGSGRSAWPASSAGLRRGRCSATGTTRGCPGPTRDQPLP